MVTVFFTLTYLFCKICQKLMMDATKLFKLFSLFINLFNAFSF